MSDAQSAGNIQQATGTDTQPAGGNASGDQQQPQNQESTLLTNREAEAGAADTKGAEEKPADEKPAGAPEKYEFVAPEGVVLDADVVSEFEGVARELNLPQDAAQKVIDKLTPKIAQKQQAVLKDTLDKAVKGWEADARADKEYGGAALDQNLAIAEGALNELGTPELKALLKQSGLSHHPEVVRLLYRAGKAIAPDGKFVGGNPKGSSGTDAKSFYPNSKMN